MVVKFVFALSAAVGKRAPGIVFFATVFSPFLALSQTKPSQQVAPVKQSSSDAAQWKAACKALESGEAEDIESAVELLRTALKEPTRVEEMACTLTLLCHKLNDIDGAQRSLSGLRSVFPKSSKETQSFALRMQLLLLLSETAASATDQLSKQVTATFRELVLRTWKDKDLTSVTLRANAATIGLVCGMLRSKSAGEVLSMKDLDVAEKCMLECDEKEVSSSFKLAFAESTQRAKDMEAIIERVKKDPVAASAEQEARKQRLADMGVDFNAQEDAAREAVRLARELTKKISNERRRIGDLLRRLDREWKTQTPGHPGQPPSRPKEPDRSDVNVDEYVGSGPNRTRKSAAQIRLEEDDEFDRLRAKYRNQLDTYARVMARYQILIDEWNQRDRARRAALRNEQALALTRQQQLVEADRQNDGEKSDAVDELQAHRSEQEKLAKEAAEYEMTQIALDAIMKESTYVAFRPPHFDLINIDSECAMLMNRIRSIK